MADEADVANRHVELERQRLQAQRKPVPDVRPKGACNYCGEPVGPEQLYCDPGCEQDHARIGYK